MNRWLTRRLAAVLLFCFAVSLQFLATAQPGGGAGVIRGDPFAGRELLSKKLCTECHSLWGHGSELGPDISMAVAGKSWLNLVGDFWNHTPRMIDEMNNRGYAWPTLDEEEMADLLSYLYYLRLFDAAGDPQRGSIAYAQHQCADCHSLGDQGGTEGGPLDSFSAYPSAVVLAQAMWNAGPRMQQDQLRRGRRIPTFDGDEMGDIQAYIRANGLRIGREVSLLPVPDPSRGAVIFGAKNCGKCHISEEGAGPDLGTAALDLTVAEISGILWNHSYTMNDMMQARGIPFPRFEGSELADLISYLYFLGFVGEAGDMERGKVVFNERGCATCHEGDSGIELAGRDSVTDPIGLSAAMWNHAPEMHGLMGQREVAWPTFDPGDMEDLTAYLQGAWQPDGDQEP